MRRSRAGEALIPVHNAEVADVFEEVADLLEIQGANPFRVRAYRTAAQNVRGLPRALHDLVREGADLSELPGIGNDLADKIAEIVRTGTLASLKKMRRRTPSAVVELLSIPGLGPKRVRALHEALHVRTRRDLARAAREGRVRRIRGFGPKIERAILTALERPAEDEPRTPWTEAEIVARDLVAYLTSQAGVRKVEVAGSFRRKCETVGDLDVLVTCEAGTSVSDHFTRYEDVARVVAHGTTRATVRLRSGLQVDLRVVLPESYGAALFYFTGSKAHNIAVRRLALEKGLKVNEYGVFRGASRVAGRTEREVYRRVGLPFIEPELRENRGEIESAKRGDLPDLVEIDDVRGDLHTHTLATDGRDDIEAMAAEARRRGYAYLAICDHTQAARVAGGLDVRAMRKHLARIDEADARLRGLRLLKSAEVDILRNGSLDLPVEVLAELDLVVCSIHSAFGLSRQQQTERILRAMDDPHFFLLAHPTGRLLGRREPYEVDLEKVIEGAVERGCALELNAQPDRMDLPDVWCRAAKNAGVKIAISTDAHSTDQLDSMRLGIGQARRAWLEADDVLNTRTWRELRKLVRARR